MQEKLSAGLGNNFVPHFLLEWLGLVRLSVGQESIGKTFSEDGWDWSNLWVGLVKPVEVGGIDQTCRRGLDRSNLWEFSATGTLQKWV